MPEIFEERTYFKRRPAAEIFPAGEEPGGASQTRSAGIFNRFSREIYKLIDSISGKKSYHLFKTEKDIASFLLSEDFRFLLSENIIKEYKFLSERYNDFPSFQSFNVTPNYRPGMTDGRIHKSAFGNGFGKDPEEVFRKAMWEFLERYFLTIYKKEKLTASSSKALSRQKQVLNISDLAGFDEEQKKKVPSMRFNENSVLYWEKARRLSSGKKIFIPAQLIYWNYLVSNREPFLREANTNGAGGYSSLEGAILAGLYELVQRDAFMINWLNAFSPEVIDLETVAHQGVRDLWEETKRYGLEVYCLYLKTDIKIPVFAVVLHDPSKKGCCFTVGAGCELDPEKAIFQALTEAWAVAYSMRGKEPFTLKNDFLPFGEPIHRIERLRLWASYEMADKLDFFISGKKIPINQIKPFSAEKFPSKKEELEAATKEVEGNGSGYEVYFFQAVNPILERLGFYSARVIVPQLVPLHLGEMNAALGSRRIKSVPEKINLKAADEINILPHPFP